MKIYGRIRTALEKNVFLPLGVDVTIRKVNYTLNDRKERTGETIVSSNVVRGVRYNQTVDFFRESIGTVTADDSTLVLPYDASVEYTDTIVVDGELFSVRNIQRVPNVENQVALLVGLSKSL